jgi:ABC-2 type transport system permease protein
VPAMRWLALAVVGGGALGGVMFGAGGVAGAVTGAASLAGSLFALLAGLSFAGEYATGAVRTTLTVVPRRSMLFLGKAIAVALVGIPLGLAAGALGATTAGGIDTSSLLPLVGSGLYVATAGLFGLFIGGLVRRVAATAVTVLILVFLLPAAAGSVRIGDRFFSDFLLGEAGPTLVSGTASWGGPLTAVALWLVVGGIVAAARLRSTDA